MNIEEIKNAVIDQARTHYVQQLEAFRNANIEEIKNAAIYYTGGDPEIMPPYSEEVERYVEEQCFIILSLGYKETSNYVVQEVVRRAVAACRGEEG